MKYILTIIFFSITMSVFGQSDVIGGRIIGKSLYLRDRWVDTIVVDTANWEGKVRTLPTAEAVRKYVAGHAGTGGGASFEESSAVTTYQNRKIVIGWGDSMTELPAGGSYTTALQTLVGVQVFNKGVAGNTSTEIRTRFNAEKQSWPYAQIFWAGANDFASKATVVANIKAMADSLGHSNYVVIAITKTSAQTTGTVGSNQVNALNDTLRQVFGQRFKDANDYFVNVVPIITAQDATDRTNGVPLSSYRSDNQHLNTLGSQYMAMFMRDSCLSVLSPAALSNALRGNDILNSFNGKSSLSSIGSVRSVNEYTESGIDLTVKGNYSYRDPEMLNNASMLTDLTGWTANNWTAAIPGATHTTGNTSALSQSLSNVLVGVLYQIEFTVASSAGTFSLSFGATTVYSATSISNGTFKRIVPAPSSGVLSFSFTPSSTFNGTISSVSIRRVRYDREPNMAIRDNANNILWQLRAYPNNSWSLGNYSMIYNQSNQYTIAIGDFSARESANSIGMTYLGYASGQRTNNSSYGTLIGYQTGRELREAQYFTALGANALFAATTANYSTAIGARSLDGVTSGNGNTGVGYLAGAGETTGEWNTSIGWQSGLYGRAGMNNVYVGRDAGYLSDYTTNGRYSGNGSVFIGGRSRPFSRTQNNQLVIGAYDLRLIGYNGLGQFLFNGMTTDQGNILTNLAFEFRSTTGALRPPLMTQTQRDAISTPGDAGMIFNSTSREFNYYDSVQGAWKSFNTVNSGVFTPTMTFVSNVSSASANGFHYTRSGSVVTFSILLTVTPTSGSTSTQVDFSLPIASNFSSSVEMIATGSAIGGTAVIATASGDPSNDRGHIEFVSTNTSAHTVTITGTYIIN